MKPNWAWDKAAAALSKKQNQKTAKSQRVKTGKTNMKATTKATKATKIPSKVKISFHALRTAALKALKIDPFSKEALQAAIKKAA
jgi:hypothetical protein